MTLWEEVKTNLLDLYNVTSDKTVEVARISSRKYEKFGISRDVERQFSELGNLVYSSIQEGRIEDIKDDEKIFGLVERIAVLEKELKAKDEEINDIRHNSTKPREKAAAAGDSEDFGADTEVKTDQGEPVETIITDPILKEGGEDAAILMDSGATDDIMYGEDINEVEGNDPPGEKSE